MELLIIEVCISLIIIKLVKLVLLFIFNTIINKNTKSNYNNDKNKLQSNTINEIMKKRKNALYNIHNFNITSENENTIENIENDDDIENIENENNIENIENENNIENIENENNIENIENENNIENIENDDNIVEKK